MNYDCGHLKCSLPCRINSTSIFSLNALHFVSRFLSLPLLTCWFNQDLRREGEVRTNAFFCSYKQILPSKWNIKFQLCRPIITRRKKTSVRRFVQVNYRKNIWKKLYAIESSKKMSVLFRFLYSLIWFYSKISFCCFSVLKVVLLFKMARKSEWTTLFNAWSRRMIMNFNVGLWLSLRIVYEWILNGGLLNWRKCIEYTGAMGTPNQKKPFHLEALSVYSSYHFSM